MTDFFVFMPARLLNVEAKALELRKVLGKPAKPFIEWLIGAPRRQEPNPENSSTG